MLYYYFKLTTKYYIPSNKKSNELPFEKITILRPSFLDGNRKESRLGEKIGMAIFKLIAWIPGIKKYRPIHVNQVAQAMRNAISKCKSGIFELDEVWKV